MTPTWRVWSPTPPECLELVSCASMLDAASAWATRQFRRGMPPPPGGFYEVLVCAQGDAAPKLSTYRVHVVVVREPAFRARLAGFAYEETPR